MQNFLNIADQNCKIIISWVIFSNLINSIKSAKKKKYVTLYTKSDTNCFHYASKEIIFIPASYDYCMIYI